MAFLSDSSLDSFNTPEKNTPEAREVALVYAVQSFGSLSSPELLKRASEIHEYLFSGTVPTTPTPTVRTGHSLPSFH